MIRKVTEDYVARLDPPHLRDQAVRSLSRRQPTEMRAQQMADPGTETLILDEADRGIDVGAKATIYQMIGELVRSGVAVTSSPPTCRKCSA